MFNHVERFASDIPLKFHQFSIVFVSKEYFNDFSTIQHELLLPLFLSEWFMYKNKTFQKTIYSHDLFSKIAFLDGFKLSSKIWTKSFLGACLMKDKGMESGSLLLDETSASILFAK